MPNYAFTRLDSDETVDLFYSMKEAPPVGTIVTYEGAKWKRVFTMPQTSMDTKIDPFSQKEFREKTHGKKGETLGHAWDRSRELSEQRAAKIGGEDPVRERFFADYSKRKKGVVHTAKLAEGQKKAKAHLEKGLAALGMKMTAKFSNT